MSTPFPGPTGSSPSDSPWRRRIEFGIRVAAPLLDLFLASADRVSRLLAREGEH